MNLSLKSYFLINVIFLLIIFNFIIAESFATSPFVRQNLKDKPIDWINVNNRSQVFFGDFSTDIEEVTYYSDGKIFNATLWVVGSLKETPHHTSSTNYGMMIDADLDKTTGIQGIDYQFEINWNNQSSSWSLTLYEYSSSGKSKILKQIENFKEFYQPESNFINLSLDLKEILVPNEMDILFYAESVKENNTLITDFTEWIRIPPPDITASLPSVVLRQGESKIINLDINSSNLEPTIEFHFNEPTEDIHLKYDYNTITLPKYGYVSIPLEISALSNASVKVNTLFVFMNVTFPEIEFIESQNNSFIPSSLIQRENMSISHSFLLTVTPKLSLNEYVGNIWNDLGGPIVFFYGILAGISPWLIKRLRDKIKKKGSS